MAVLFGIMFFIITVIFISISVKKTNIENLELILDDKPKYFYENGRTGIAISSDLQKIALSEGDHQKVYDIEQIRGHKTSLIKPDQIFGRHIGMAAHVHNFTTGIKAIKQSGLFVEVKDIDNPVWRIKMFRRADQQRWHEILCQLYEGGTLDSVDDKKRTDLSFCPKCRKVDSYMDATGEAYCPNCKEYVKNQ